jgi:hypothetical protein
VQDAPSPRVEAPAPVAEGDAPSPADSPKTAPTEDTAGAESERIERELRGLTQEAGEWPAPKRQSFLARVALANPLATIDAMGSVNPAKDRYLSTMVGSFRGPVRFLTKQPAGRVRMDLREADPEAPSRWLVLIEVNDGRGHKSRQTGGREMLRTVSPASSAYAIRASETSYLQLFYRESERRFVGNFYEKRGQGTYERRGTVVLDRVE